MTLVEGDSLVAIANIPFLAASTHAKETKAAATEFLEKLFAILAGDAPEREGDAIIALSTMIGAMTLARVEHPADPDFDGEDLSGAFFFPQRDCHHHSRKWVIQYSRVPI